MKKTLFTLLTAINLTFLYCPAVAVFALIKDESATAVDSQGKDAVSGNLFLWLLCAIAFLKVVTKLDGILHSLGIGVSRSPGNIFASGLSGMVSHHVQQSAASSISGQSGGSITGDSTVEALKDYFTGTSDMDAIPIPAISENISTARAQRLYKTEVFAVNKYPICAASYTICIFICIYYVSVYFYKKAGLFHPAFLRERIFFMATSLLHPACGTQDY